MKEIKHCKEREDDQGGSWLEKVLQGSAIWARIPHVNISSQAERIASISRGRNQFNVVQKQEQSLWAGAVCVRERVVMMGDEI